MADITRTPGVLAAISRALRAMNLEDAVIANPTVLITQPGSTAGSTIPAFYASSITASASTNEIINSLTILAGEMNINRGVLNRLTDVLQTHNMVLST